MSNTAALTVPGIPAAILSIGQAFIVRQSSRSAMEFETSGRDSDPAVVATRARECGEFLASVHDVGAYAAPRTSYSHPSQVVCQATDEEIMAVVDGMGW